MRMDDQPRTMGPRNRGRGGGIGRVKILAGCATFVTLISTYTAHECGPRDAMQWRPTFDPLLRLTSIFLVQDAAKRASRGPLVRSPEPRKISPEVGLWWASARRPEIKR
jgi:hypothetical protein